MRREIDPALLDRVLTRLLQVVCYLERTMKVAFSDVYNLSSTKVRIISRIGRGNSTVKSLGLESLGTNLGYNLKGLEDDGFLTINGDSRDRRVVRVKLTERGLQVLGAIEKQFLPALAKLLASRSIDSGVMETMDGILQLMESLFAQASKTVKVSISETSDTKDRLEVAVR